MPEKHEKLQGFKFAYVNCKGLRKYLSKLIENKFAPGPTYLQTIFSVPKTWATKLAETTNIENVSTPTLLITRPNRKSHTGFQSIGTDLDDIK